MIPIGVDKIRLNFILPAITCTNWIYQLETRLTFYKVMVPFDCRRSINPLNSRYIRSISSTIFE